MIDTIIFCHGFGLNPSFFDELKTYLKGFNFIDWNLGYFSDISLEKIDSAVAVGHSLGFYKLYEQKHAFKGIISLGGFFDFLCDCKKRMRELEKLQLAFQESETTALKRFHENLNYQHSISSFINKSRLLEDLECLKRPLVKDEMIPVLAIGAEDDQIVSKDVFLRNFSNINPILLNDGGHCFVNKHAHEISHYILEFIKEVS
jgi:hypothetical protein